MEANTEIQPPLACATLEPPLAPACFFLEVIGKVDLGILVLDTQSDSVLFASQAALNLLSEAQIPLAAAPLKDLFLPSDSEPLSQPLSIRVGSHVFGYTLYGEGSMKWVFFHDSTEKEWAQSILSTAEAMAGLAHVFSALRHEIGNPINSIKTALDVLSRNLDRFSRETTLDYLGRCSVELDRIEELLRCLKAFSLYDVVRPREVHLDSFLSHFRSLVANDLLARGVAMDLQLDGEMSNVQADPLALEHVLFIALANSLEALHGRPRPGITIRSAAHGSLATLRFEDNGCGMSDAVRSQLFKPLANYRPGRAGLGLSIARKVLAEMQGAIAVESEEGVGTALTITLSRGGNEAH